MYVKASVKKQVFNLKKQQHEKWKKTTTPRPVG
mgnify:CR=1 FL=1